MPSVERIWLPGEQIRTKRIEGFIRGILIPAALQRNLDELTRAFSSRADGFVVGRLRRDKFSTEKNATRSRSYF